MNLKTILHFCSMKNYLRNWDFVRALRLGLGLIILIQGIVAGEILFVILGGLMAVMPLFNVGCCGSTSCRT